ncbi:MAG: alanine racemase [Acidobacteriota bacterium]
MERETKEAVGIGAADAAVLPKRATSWLEIDLDAFAHNVRTFRGLLAPGCRLAAVVKSNAYGHGAGLVAPVALAEGAGLLAVGNLDEALSLRATVGPGAEILVLGWVPPDGFEDAARADVELTIYDPQVVAPLAAASRRARRPVRVHLKVETGTHRQGVDAARLAQLAAAVHAADGLELRGLSTHFADIEDTTDHGYAMRQLELFRQAARALEQAGLRPALRHAACSAAALLFPETHFDVARAGIGLYGFWPSRETRVSARERGLDRIALRPVMSWRARIAQVKQVPAGAYVGYGRTYRTTRPSRIAVLPVGYYEGLDRSVSGRGHVLVRGRRAAILGRVCMNMTMVDVTDVPDLAAGDPVTLIGRSGDEVLRAEDLADWAGTIHYEIVSRVHPSVPRVPVRRDEPGGDAPAP